MEYLRTILCAFNFIFLLMAVDPVNAIAQSTASPDILKAENTKNAGNIICNTGAERIAIWNIALIFENYDKLAENDRPISMPRDIRFVLLGANDDERILYDRLLKDISENTIYKMHEVDSNGNVIIYFMNKNTSAELAEARIDASKKFCDVIPGAAQSECDAVARAFIDDNRFTIGQPGMDSVGANMFGQNKKLGFRIQIHARGTKEPAAITSALREIISTLSIPAIRQYQDSIFYYEGIESITDSDKLMLNIIGLSGEENTVVSPSKWKNGIGNLEALCH